MPRTRLLEPAAPRVLGAAPLRMTKKVTDEILRALRDKLSQNGGSVTVKSIRFIPSSRTTTESGSFQVVANTVIEVLPGNDSPPRPEALDSVVTVGRRGRVQRLEALSIPALQRATS